MSYETRAYDNDAGDPVVVLVATGTHDVSRLVNLLDAGNCEQGDLARKVLGQVRRHNGGRAALALLAKHGGPDFTGVDDADVVDVAAARSPEGETVSVTDLLKRAPAWEDINTL